jgi:hypothetical protein
MKYKINSIRLKEYGQVGEIVELDDISTIPFNSYLEEVTYSEPVFEMKEEKIEKKKSKKKDSEE